MPPRPHVAVLAGSLVLAAIDSSGWVAESDPVYVCLVDNLVGPCG